MPPNKPQLAPPPPPEHDTEHGAPHWGTGLRNDLRDGFAGLRADVRQQTLAGAVFGIVALVLMAGLVTGSIYMQASKDGLQLNTSNTSELATTPAKTEPRP